MKTLTNITQIKNRLAKLHAKTPAKPLKNLGFSRVECLIPRVFMLLCRHCPMHCSVFTQREAINRFGKLGFVAHNYVSPELQSVLKANENDFLKLEEALRTVSEFGL